MNKKILTQKQLIEYERHLYDNERSTATVEKYIREVSNFYDFVQRTGRLDRAVVMSYRDMLRFRNKPQTVNGKLCAIHGFLDFIGRPDCKCKFYKVQRRAFLDEAREMSEAEYKRLLSAARGAGNERLYYLMLTLAGTGIRISELRFITVEAVRRGRAEITLKGKSRTVLIPQELRKKLMAYISNLKITSGYVFRTKSGRSLDRSNIWSDMKKLCKNADVDPSKVFPHSFRHLFARHFYAIEKDIARLADILGHSSIETTRIYIAVSAREYERVLNRMRLII